MCCLTISRAYAIWAWDRHLRPNVNNQHTIGIDLDSHSRRHLNILALSHHLPSSSQTTKRLDHNIITIYISQNGTRGHQKDECPHIVIVMGSTPYKSVPKENALLVIVNDSHKFLIHKVTRAVRSRGSNSEYPSEIARANFHIISETPQVSNEHHQTIGTVFHKHREKS